MPGGVYGLLRAKRLRLPDRSRHPACGLVLGTDGRCVRAAICISYAQPAAPAGAARFNLFLPASRRLLDSPRETYAMPGLPVLAGVGGQPAQMAEDRRLLPRHRTGPADPDRDRANAVAGNAGR